MANPDQPNRILIDGRDLAEMTSDEKDAKLIALVLENEALQIAAKGCSVGMLRLQSLENPRGAKKPVHDEGGL